jgi:hypothetical protein
VDTGQHLGQIKRFADKVFRPGFECAQFFCRLGGDDQNGQIAACFDFVQTFHHIEAAQTRHLKVQQDQIVVVLAVQFAHFARVLRRRDAKITCAAKHALEQQHVGRLVVHDQQLGLKDVR